MEAYPYNKAAVTARRDRNQTLLKILSTTMERAVAA
jgi:hypothetical protein